MLTSRDSAHCLYTELNGFETLVMILQFVIDDVDATTPVTFACHDDQKHAQPVSPQFVDCFCPCDHAAAQGLLRLETTTSLTTAAAG